MLRNPFFLPCPAARILYPASAVFLNVLTAVTLIAALQSPWAERGEETALTSGGKFAARIPGVETTVAGLTIAPAAGAPLPVMIHPGELAAALASLATPGALWDEAIGAKTAAPLAKLDTLKLRADRSRVMDPVIAIPKAVMAAATSAKVGDGVLPKIMSSVQSVWSMTASAGGSLMSHILPQ